MTPSHPARISVVADPPAGVTIAVVIPADRRLVAGLESGPDARATHLGDDLLSAADSAPDPLVLDMRGVDWIDSGACAVLIKVWKALRLRGQPLVLCVTDPVRETFRAAAARLGWDRPSHPVDGTGPAGEDLTIDAAVSPHPGADRVLVVSGGLH